VTLREVAALTTALKKLTTQGGVLMKNTVLLMIAVVACLSIGAAATVTMAMDEKGEMAQTAKQPSHDEMMAMWMKLAAPGEHHSHLKALAGSWSTVVKTWEGPGEPKVSGGSCESTWMLGDRFLKEEYSGTYEGQAFQGMGLTGYDNVKKKYVNTWIDNMGTGIMMSEGTMDPVKKTITFRSRMPDPMNPTSGKTVPLRMTTRIIDDGKHVFTMYGMHEGKEVPEMEITYTRK